MRRFICSLIISLFVASTAFAFPNWVQVGIGSHDVRWRGGSGTLSVAGTFGGATVTFFYCAPLTGVTQCYEVDATNCTFTAVGTCDFFKGPGDLQLVVAGGTPSITAVAAGPTQASASGGGGGGAGLISITETSPDTIYEALAPGGTFRFRENGGAGAFDFVITPGTPVRLDTMGGNLEVFRNGIFVFETESGAGNTQIIMDDNVRIIGDPGGPTSVQFGVSNTSGFSATAAGGIFGISGGASVFAGDSSTFSIASGFTLGLPSSASPPVTCSGSVDGHLYWDTAQNLVCRCDSATWAGVGGGVTCT